MNPKSKMMTSPEQGFVHRPVKHYPPQPPKTSDHGQAHNRKRTGTGPSCAEGCTTSTWGNRVRGGSAPPPGLQGRIPQADLQPTNLNPIRCDSVCTVATKQHKRKRNHPSKAHNQAKHNQALPPLRPTHAFLIPWVLTKTASTASS